NAPDGLLGPMSELVTVEPGFETAIAGALGPAVDGIVTVDGIAAVRALEALKAGDGGRAALICGGLDGAAVREREVPLPEGARWASSVVRCGPEIRGAIDTVLADTIIVD